MRLAFVSILMLGAACSSGGGGSVSSGGSGPFTSVSAGKQVSSLSDSEKRQLCTDLANWYTTTVPGTNKASCAQSAFSATANTTDPTARRTACQQAYQECLAKPRKTETFTASDVDKCATAPELSNCSSTVGEINDCFAATTELLHSADAVYDGYCNSIQPDGGVSLPEGTSTTKTLPASCQAVQAHCPGLFGEAQVDGTGSGSGSGPP